VYLHEIGTIIPALPFKVDSVRTLIYFDGPLLQEHMAGDQIYLMCWLYQHNQDALVVCGHFPVEARAYGQYLKGEVSLRAMVCPTPPNKCYLESRFQGSSVVREASTTDIPEEFLPSYDSFFEPEDLPDGII